jgi:glucose uptake protein
MYQPEAYALALVFMLTSMICWGSWANTLKLAPGYPFQLFYWDYIIGLIIGSLLWGVTLGSLYGGPSAFFASLGQADQSHLLYALASGIVFNIANLLLVAAIEIAGLAVAFPLGIGLALVVGVLTSYVQSPKGDPLLLFGGVLLVVVAIVLNALAYRRRETVRSGITKRGIWISVACGLLMGSFYPLVTAALTGEGALGPYSVAFVFAIGAALCALPFNYLLMRKPLTNSQPLTMSEYAQARPRWHVIGILGGGIWITGTVFNIVAASAQIVGPAISYAIGQGATLVSVVWGVFVWHEFRDAPANSRRLLLPMFLLFAAGLGAIACAPLFSR